MVDPLITYSATVTYFLAGELKDYTGSFSGMNSEEAILAARLFVTRYLRPNYIESAKINTTEAVVVLS